ncbi:DUF3667 domain-containing protein [candidate division CSSED10-310 bacterium]|uniref:DUF3667 domain-containing protein n=1 Tax=candidate division CSSED10-310 bacterium TaxID=2855610 RepID=A0ABV6Z4H1_UNCC1
MNHTENKDVCLNCGAPLDGSFCAQCGQKNISPRLQMGDLFSDFFTHFLNVEAVLPKTLIGLTVNPGRVAREYVTGKRIRYLNPLKYCLILAACFMLLNAALHIDVTGGMTERLDTFQSQSQSQTEFIGAARKLILFTFSHLDKFLLLVLPLYAVILFFLFPRSGFNITEILAFLLLVTGHRFLFAMLATLLSLIFPWLLIPIRLVFLYVYFAYAAVVFFDVPPVSGTIKAFAATFIYIFMVVVIMFLLLIVLLLSS